MADAVTSMPSRSLPLWLMITALVMSVLAGVFVLLWFKLPTWAPKWVVEHSPWVDPIMRAVEAEQDLGTPARDRIVPWGPSQTLNILPWLDHLNPRIRSLAVECLGGIKDSRALPALLRAVTDPERDVVHEAIQALGDLGDAKAVPTLVGALRRSDLAWGYASGSLLKMPHAAVADEVLPLPDAANDEDNRILGLACALNDAHAVSALRDVMRSPPDEPLAEGVIASFATRQEQAALGLALSPHPAGIPTLITAFADPDERIRLHAVAGVAMTYGRKLDPRLLHLQVQALDDPHPKVRMIAALSFRFLKADSVELKLIRMSSEPDPLMRSYAVSGLGSKWASEAAIARLIEAMRDPDEKASVGAVASLANTESSKVLSPLIAELAIARGRTRTRILESFTRKPFVNDARVFPFLLELLAHSKQFHHELALSALARLQLSDDQQRQVDEIIARRRATSDGMIQ